MSFNKVFEITGTFSWPDLSTPVYRDICRTCEAPDLRGRGFVTPLDSWYVKITEFVDLLVCGSISVKSLCPAYV